VSPAKKILFPRMRPRRCSRLFHTSRARPSWLDFRPAAADTSCIKRAVPSTPMGMSVGTTFAPRSAAAREAADR
jgi:hypothetical protein